MNQIPNIEETHNTREVEEVVKDYLERFPEFPQDLLNCTLNQEALDELNRARLRGANWLRTTLHQQLQKAREEERERCIKVVEDYGEKMAKHQTRMIGIAHNDCKEMLSFDLHSRRIAITHILKALDHSELDQLSV